MSSSPDRLHALRDALADRYRIEREIGAGGMATVYLAHDLRHDRNVALKVLRPELAAVLGAERFVQEIRTTAQLQHPHILPLFDSGTADGFLYYVMPFIDGETLRNKLDRERQLGIDEAVRIAREVADALDYAHRHGVIHRDIKPENILLHDGRPVVADFGIALAVSAAAGGRMTETGLSLGTPHYMSPEQATAEREITARSDIYSLGCVLYEMLAGDPPHVGATAQQIIMKIIAEEAQPVTRLRRSVPPEVADAVAIALEKLPADRWSAAREFADALAGERRRRPQRAARPTSPVPPRKRVATAALAGALVLALAAAGWGWLRGAPPVTGPPVARLAILPPQGVAIDGIGGRLMAISRDGSLIVFAGRIASQASSPRMLFARRIGDAEARAIPGTEGAERPFLSPDGAWIGFLRGDTIKRIPVAGGMAQTVTGDARTNQASWGDDGTIAFVHGGRLATVPAFGGQRVEVPLPDSILVGRPAFLPGSRAFLATRQDGDQFRVIVIDRATGAHTVVVEDGADARYVPTGHVVFGRLDGGVYAVPFDLKRLRTTGPARPVLDDVLVLSGGTTQLAVADNGTAVFLPGTDDRAGELVLVALDGAERVLGSPALYRSNPRYSPDGRQIAVSRGDRGAAGIWVVDADRGVASRRTSGAQDLWPIWSRDGGTLMFSRRGGAADARGVYRMPADGSGAPTRLAADPRLALFASTPDGSTLLGDHAGTGLYRNLVTLTLAGDSAEMRTWLEEPWQVAYPDLSPDGRWAAYVSSEGGTPEIFVRGFPSGGVPVRVSPEGGLHPRWSADGRSLFYRHPQDASLAVAAIAFEPALRVERVQDLDGLLRETGWYDVHPSGTQFVAIRQVGITRHELHVVLNWFTAIAERFAEGAR
jgi:eukaryotic-like serine/threonine-protein kinase